MSISQILSFSLVALIQLSQPYQIAFGGWGGEIHWEKVSVSINRENPPCVPIVEFDDPLDIWVRSGTVDRAIPPYIALYGTSSNRRADQGCQVQNIVQVFAYYDLRETMQSSRITVPGFAEYWREIYPESMPDDFASQLIEGAGLEPGEVLTIDFESRSFIKADYPTVQVNEYNYIPALEPPEKDYGGGGMEEEYDDYSPETGGSAGYDYDTDDISLSSPPLYY
ncbi:hypothetical protein TWF281_011658 [Arthrobotrys megalospora]